jgi:hypothetical protein
MNNISIRINSTNTIRVSMIGGIPGPQGVTTKASVEAALTGEISTHTHAISETIELKKFNEIQVAKSGGQFTTIQEAIDYAVLTYPARTSNDPVVITVHAGDYNEQIHSYYNIIIQSSAAAYDPIHGKSKAIISNTGLDPATYPLRTEAGDVYYMLGMAIDLTTADGVYGRVPEGTFKNCYFKDGHFIDSDTETQTNSQFKDCSFNDTYGGFYTTGTYEGYRNMFLIDCKLRGNPTFLSDHNNGHGHVTMENVEIRGKLTYNGDWELNSIGLKSWGGAGRNTFSTTGFVRMQNGYQVNGIDFTAQPADLSLLGIGFASIKPNEIPDGEADITADIPITGTIRNNVMRNGYSAEVHMAQPDKYVGYEVNDSYINIKAALDSITDSGPANRYTITVSSGIYVEDNPIQAKEYVALKAVGDLQTTRIVAANPNADLIIMANLFTMEGIAFWGVSGANNYALNASTASNGSITRCMFGECSNGILINHVDAKLTVNDCAVFNPTVPLLIGATCLAGRLDTFGWHANYGTIGTLIKLSGVNTFGILDYVNSPLSTVTTGIFIGDQAEVTITNAQFKNMGTAIEIEGGAHVHLNNATISAASLDGVRVNDVGTGTTVKVQGAVIEDSVRYDFNLLSSTCEVSGNANMSINKLNFVDGATMYGTIIDLEEDDEGFTIIGELHVGLPEKGTESVFGEGDSYSRGMLVYTETELGVFTDRSVEARSPSGSTFTFDGLAPDNAIYMASSLQNASGFLNHLGIKIKVATAKVSGIIVLEYWNGAAWVGTPGMEVDSDGSHWPHAVDYFEDTGSHQIRYSSELIQDSWTLYDPMSLGTDYLWTRFRITSAPTTAPVFEQFKLHTNRIEINADGWMEYFGKARPIGQLPLSITFGKAIEGTMGSQEIYVSENLGSGFTFNEFTNNNQIIGVSGFLPFDTDTSSPIVLEWAGRPTSDETITFTVRWGYVTEGGSYFTAEPGIQSHAKVTTIAKAVLTGEMAIFSANLDISEMLSRREGAFGDELWISIQATTMTGNLALTSSQVLYTKWCDGGHI